MSCYLKHEAQSLKIRLCDKTQINAVFTHKTKDKQNDTIQKPVFRCQIVTKLIINIINGNKHYLFLVELRTNMIRCSHKFSCSVVVYFKNWCRLGPIKTVNNRLLNSFRTSTSQRLFSIWTKGSFCLSWTLFWAFFYRLNQVNACTP